MHISPLLLFGPTVNIVPSLDSAYHEGYRCNDFNVPVSVSRTTEQSFEGQSYSVDVLYALARKDILVSNSYTLSSRLCTPLVTKASNHSDTIQLLIHGASFSKSMWDPTYEPGNYSWVRRMADEGYATLAVDLIGKTVVRIAPAVNELMPQWGTGTVHSLTDSSRLKLRHMSKQSTKLYRNYEEEKLMVRSGRTSYLSVSPSAPSWPTRSRHSTQMMSMQSSYTGYPGTSHGSTQHSYLASRLLHSKWTPERWGHIEAFYQTQSNREGRKAACFAGDYDPAILEHDW